MSKSSKLPLGSITIQIDDTSRQHRLFAAFASKRPAVRKQAWVKALKVMQEPLRQLLEQQSIQVYARTAKRPISADSILLPIPKQIKEDHLTDAIRQWCRKHSRREGQSPEYIILGQRQMKQFRKLSQVPIAQTPEKGLSKKSERSLTKAVVEGDIIGVSMIEKTFDSWFEVCGSISEHPAS